MAERRAKGGRLTQADKVRHEQGRRRLSSTQQRQANGLRERHLNAAQGRREPFTAAQLQQQSQTLQQQSRTLVKYRNAIAAKKRANRNFNEFLLVRLREQSYFFQLQSLRASHLGQRPLRAPGSPKVALTVGTPRITLKPLPPSPAAVTPPPVAVSPPPVVVKPPPVVAPPPVAVKPPPPAAVAQPPAPRLAPGQFTQAQLQEQAQLKRRQNQENANLERSTRGARKSRNPFKKRKAKKRYKRHFIRQQATHRNQMRQLRARHNAENQNR